MGGREGGSMRWTWDTVSGRGGEGKMWVALPSLTYNTEQQGSNAPRTCQTLLEQPRPSNRC
jgi:hypothetical protein